MAEQVVALVLEKIASHLIEEAGSLLKVRDQVEWIQGELKRMQCFLKEADSRQDGDERNRNWIADVRDVAYDTDDLVEDYILKMAAWGMTGKVVHFRRYLYFMNELILRHKFNNRVQRIKHRIQEIAISRSTYGIDNLGEGREKPSSVSKLQEKRRVSVYNSEEDVVGLVEDVRAIESWLIGGESRRCVVSAFGMAGIGKTTLAKKVYCRSDVKKHFDCCAWVTVSQDYRSKETLFDLGKKLMGITKADLEAMDTEDLLERISTFLENKRYFIVLDDIWNSEVWDEVKAAFPERNNGSRIMLTTRFKDVALHADPKSPPHEMCLLNEETSWELFSRKLILEWKSMTDLPPWAEELGRQILKRCGGLPLAIIVVAGLLSRKDANFSEWLKVLQSMHWQLKQDPMRCSDILALSYNDLPYYLKSCFLYFGFFPEDFEIPARRLILLWVAEGFVQPRGQEPLEDVAEDYLEEMISRSMVQVAKRKSSGKVKACRLHDLLRELSISKAKDDSFLDVIHGDGGNEVLSRGRRLAVQFGALPATQNKLKLRSLLCFELNKAKLPKLKKFRLLRVLDLEGVYLTQLDSGIGKLIHLRYLGLRGTWLKRLPSSVGNLIKLETLDLRSTLIDPIPFPIWKLKGLRNLYFNELKEMTINPPPDATLPNLQTIRGLCIINGIIIEGGLDKLTNIKELILQGELRSHEKSLAKWISMSKKLECLKLQASGTSGDNLHLTLLSIPKLTFTSHFHLSKLHLDGFIRKMYEPEEFPPNLTELSLEGSYLMEDPMPKLEKLPNLRVLKLKRSAYVGKESVCSRGGFPQVQFLKLAFLTLETWRIEEGALRNLRQLEVIECKNLKIVPNGLHPVTTLRDLKLGYFSSDFESKVQDRNGENWYRIHHVPPI